MRVRVSGLASGLNRFDTEGIRRRKDRYTKIYTYILCDIYLPST